MERVTANIPVGAIQVLLAMSVLCLLGGCMPSTVESAPEESADLEVPSVHLGMSLAELRESLTEHAPLMEQAVGEDATKLDELVAKMYNALWLQFRTERDRDIVTCVSSRVSTHPSRFYFILVNDKLTRIVDPPPIDIRIVMRDGKRFGTRVVDADARVDLVLESEGISIEEAVRRAEETAEAVQAQAEPPPIPKFLWEMSEWKSDAELAKERALGLELFELRKKYDPWRAQLGDTPEQTVETFGEPRTVKQLGNDVAVYAFGAEYDWDYWGRWAAYLPWFELKFRDGAVVAIYSGSFVVRGDE
jgi:hypothetical protein